MKDALRPLSMRVVAALSILVLGFMYASVGRAQGRGGDGPTMSNFGSSSLGRSGARSEGHDRVGARLSSSKSGGANLARAHNANSRSAAIVNTPGTERNLGPNCRRRTPGSRCELDRIIERNASHHRVAPTSANYPRGIYDGDGDGDGYDDGLMTGAKDAYRRQSHDPQRSHFFKRAVGVFVFTSDTYKSTYRDGFRRGYEEGYQNYQHYFSNGKFHR